MTAENLTQHPEDESILTLIQKIKDDLFDPRLLSKEQRQQCVEVLNAEGLTEVTIAQILGVSTKTIYRDMLAIRERNSLSPNIDLAKQIIGEYVHRMRIHHSYHMRLARSKEASISEKIQAEYYASTILNQFIERLQSLGYLPSRPQQIVGDLFHHVDDQSLEKSFQDARNVLGEIINVAQQSGTLTPELQQNVSLLQQKVDKAEIIDETNKLSKQSNETKEGSHD